MCLSLFSTVFSLGLGHSKCCFVPGFAGLLESPLITLDETLVIAEIMETIRKQVGVVYPQDEQ